MTYEEVVRKAIREYYKDRDPENYNETKDEVKYTREYFDELEAEMVPAKKKKSKKKADSEEGMTDGD